MKWCSHTSFIPVNDLRPCSVCYTHMTQLFGASGISFFCLKVFHTKVQENRCVPWAPSFQITFRIWSHFFIIMDRVSIIQKYVSYNVIYFKYYRRLLIWLCYNFINVSEAVYTFHILIRWKTAFIFRILSAKIALKAVCLIKPWYESGFIVLVVALNS